MSAAASWQSAGDRLPAEVSASLESSGQQALAKLELLLAIPEWEVRLPGGVTTSHTDVLALARNDLGLVVLAIEAKVDEPFGPTIGEKRKDTSIGQSQRLAYLASVLKIRGLPDSVYYQLVHRAVSAVLVAQAFHAHAAVMFVQSFSPTAKWRGEFDQFCQVLGTTVQGNCVAAVPGHSSPSLFVGWCTGDQQFREVDLRKTRPE
jgi:hypothetical protein